MVKSIILNNVQVHKELALNFSPGVNVLIGPTDSGKSSIIRALNLGLNNVPRGGEKIYLMESATEPLQITIQDFKGNVINRVNRTYTINNGTPLSAFNQDKPEAVAEIIRTNEVNFQLQIQPHFLILETGGNAAKILNAVTGMEDQMLLLTEVKSRITATRRDYLNMMAEKEGAIAKIGQLEYAPVLLNQLQAVKKQQIQLDQHELEIKNLHESIQNLKNSLDQFQSLSFLDDLELKFSKIFEESISYDALLKAIESLSTIIRKVNDNKKLLLSHEKWDKHEQHILSLQLLAFDLKAQEEQIDSLAILIHRIKEREQQSQNLDFQIDEYQMQFNDLMAAAGVCPLCGASQQKKGGVHSC